MNYWKLYCNLIKKARKREKIMKYSEKHHIIPKCLKGSNKPSNIIELTGREHFLAHLFLAKSLICNKQNSWKLWHAVNLMMYDKRRIYNSKSYQFVKEQYSEKFSEYMLDKWRNDKEYRRKHSIGTSKGVKRSWNNYTESEKKERLMKSNFTGDGVKFGKENPVYGKKQSKEHIEKRFKNIKGIKKNFSREYREKIAFQKSNNIFEVYEALFEKRIGRFKQYTKGKYIGQWSNIALCAEELGLSGQGISKCLKGTIKRTGNYMFTYKESI